MTLEMTSVAAPGARHLPVCAHHHGMTPRAPGPFTSPAFRLSGLLVMSTPRQPPPVFDPWSPKVLEVPATWMEPPEPVPREPVVIDRQRCALRRYPAAGQRVRHLSGRPMGTAQPGLRLSSLPKRPQPERKAARPPRDEGRTGRACRPALTPFSRLGGARGLFPGSGGSLPT